MQLELTPKQCEAMDALASEQYNFILFGGAMGGGKTVWGLSALLIMCRLFPKSRWIVIREDLEKLRTTTIPSFKRLEPSGKLRESPYEYTHPNGSVIMFKGENYDSDKEGQWMRGLEVNGCLFEEINECREQSLDIMFSRVARWECENRPKPIIFATCNPSNTWIKTRVFDKWKDGTLPATWLYIQSKVTDNPYLTPEYLENLKNMPRFRYEVLVEGNWDLQLKVGGEFYKCFELDKHVKDFGPDNGYNPELPLHISWDDNVNPYLPCGIFQIEGKEIRMIDEIAGVTPSNTVERVCSEIKRKYQGHDAGMFIYGDATANKEDTKLEKGMNFYKLILQYLAQYKPVNRVLAGNASVVMRGNWINTVLEKELGGIKVWFGANCKKAISDMILVKEAADGTKLKETETNTAGVRYQKVGHFSDLCFVGETMVQTFMGEKRIDEIVVGDLVLTRDGYKKVLRSVCNGIKEVRTYQIGQHKITCTPDHKVWTKEFGFKEVSLLIYSTMFCIFDAKQNEWQLKKLPITDITSKEILKQIQGLGAFIFLVEQKLTVKAEKLGCMFINIWLRLEQFQKDMSFIMSMIIHQIMKHQILSVSHADSISVTTCLSQRGKSKARNHWSYMQDQQLIYGTAPNLAESGIAKTPKETLKSINKTWLVLSVKKILLALSELAQIIQNIVVQNARIALICERIDYLANGTKREFVLAVIKSLRYIGIINSNSVGVSVQPVFDITVEQSHEFFANNILVHNCDYIMCSAFATDFKQYQNGGPAAQIKTSRNPASKNAY